MRVSEFGSRPAAGCPRWVQTIRICQALSRSETTAEVCHFQMAARDFRPVVANAVT